MTNSTPTPPPSVPQGMREAIGNAIRLYQDPKDRSDAVDRILAAIAPHVEQAGIPVQERTLLSALRWYAGNNGWKDYGSLNQHHPKIRDCGAIAREALLEHAALAAGWELDRSPGTEGWDVGAWRTPAGKLVRADELGEHFDVATSDNECPTRQPAATPPSLPASEGKADAAAMLANERASNAYAIAEKDKWGKYWHDLAQERIVQLSDMTRERDNWRDTAKRLETAPTAAVLTRAKEALEEEVKWSTGIKSERATRLRAVLADLTALLSAPENKEKNEL